MRETAEDVHGGCWLVAARRVAALARKWTDNTEKYSVEAELVEVQGDKVVLKKTTGSTVTMPIARLSKADREYLQSLGKPGPNQTTTVGRRAIEAALEKRHDFRIRQMPLAALRGILRRKKSLTGQHQT